MDLKNLGPLKNISLLAASGLVKYQQKLYVIADDSLTLLIFDLANQMQASTLPLIPGFLPEDFKLRKKIKPDFEALVILTSSSQVLLIAVPSGSELNRQTGVAIQISEDSPKVIASVNFSELFTELRKEILELNIEGACATGSTLQLFQRGNGANHKNAVIHLDLKQVLESIVSQKPISSQAILRIIYYDLGLLNGVPLAFTDACADGRGNIFFLAVAEDTTSTYTDGSYVGSILGCIDSSGNMRNVKALLCPDKPEGLWIERMADEINIFVVTDADSEKQSAILYRGKFSI